MKRTGRDHDGRVIIFPPTTAEEHITIQRESKARTTLLQSIPYDHVALTLKTKDGLKLLSLDDLYYKLKTLEVDVKGYTTFSSSLSARPSHSAFVSATSASKKMSYGDTDTEEASTAGDAGEFALMGVTSETKLDNHLVQTEKWRNSSKNLFRLIDSSISVRTKVGLGFTNYISENELGWDDSTFSVFTTNSEDVEGRPTFHRFTKTDSIKVVPPPLSRDYTSLSDHADLDESQMSYVTSLQRSTQMTLPPVILVSDLQSTSQMILPPVHQLPVTGKVTIPPARPQPVSTGKPKVFASVPTGRQNRPFPVPTNRGYSPSVISGIDGQPLFDDTVAALLTKAFDGPRVFNSPMLHLLRVEMVINSPWIMPILGTKELANPEQTALGGGGTLGGGDVDKFKSPFVGGDVDKEMEYYHEKHHHHHHHLLLDKMKIHDYDGRRLKRRSDKLFNDHFGVNGLVLEQVDALLVQRHRKCHCHGEGSVS
nr:ribonuclease H-like domain, Gag-pre-integrase domain protein [Tanacetum cinerariifolium]